MRKLVPVFALLVIAASAPATAGSAGDVQKAIEEATAAVKKADEVGFAWRDSEKMIKDAKAAAEKGDTAKALELAKTAKMQGELGYQQHLDQKDAGPKF